MVTIPIDGGPQTLVAMAVLQDEDWLDPLPQFLDRDDETGAEVPLDLTGMTLELYVRPTFDHPTIVKKLSTADGSIVFDDASLGLTSIHVERPDVIADLPIGSWQQFLLAKEPSDGLDGFAYRELWRGPLIVYGGRTELRGLDFSDPLNSQYLPLIGLFGG
ncbi:MAG: hypothetical protein J0H94_03875 [Rhizobiales bacterium]|nr:hypothetical protein [Hyphomicrobiales bacterium]